MACPPLFLFIHDGDGAQGVPMLGKCSTTHLHTDPLSTIVFIYFISARRGLYFELGKGNIPKVTQRANGGVGICG